MDCVLRAVTIIMMYWIELLIACVVGFCAGVAFMGALMKGVRRVAEEDRIVTMMQEDFDWPRRD